jgi:hypothetical protein
MTLPFKTVGWKKSDHHATSCCTLHGRCAHADEVHIDLSLVKQPVSDYRSHLCVAHWVVFALSNGDYYSGVGGITVHPRRSSSMAICSAGIRRSDGSAAVRRCAGMTTASS